MSGMLNSAGGFLGLSSGPQFSQGYNSSQDQLNQMNNGAGQGGDILNQYAQGGLTADQAMQQGADRWQSDDPYANMGFQNELATGATTGSKFATDQVQSNPILGSLFGQNGEMNKQEGILDNLQNQGFNLTQGDNTLYGQESGQIANQFAQQGSQAASDLANRGLSSSGAAGSMFSGIAGNQNQMLADAQQQIAQQRFTNVQNQIAQQQQMVSSLGQQAGNDINQQYSRQLGGAQNQTGAESQAANVNMGVGNQNLQSQQLTQENAPQNAFDMAQGGVNAAMGAGGKSAGQSMFGGKTAAPAAAAVGA